MIDRYSLCGVCAILLWSLTVALGRSLTEQLGPLTAAASVYTIGGIYCLAYILLTPGTIKRILELPRYYLFGCGTLFVLYMLCLFLAIGFASNRQQVLEVGLINYLWPALTILFSLWILGNHAKPILAPGTLIALSGVFLVLNRDNTIALHSMLSNFLSNPAAYLLALIAAITWALYSNLTRRWAESKSGNGAALFIPATGLILLTACTASHEQSIVNLRAVIEAFIMGSVTALGYVLWDIAMKKGNVVLVAACSYFTPLFSTAISCIYLGIHAGIELWLGCVAIVIGSLISWFAVSEHNET